MYSKKISKIVGMNDITVIYCFKHNQNKHLHTASRK